MSKAVKLYFKEDFLGELYYNNGEYFFKVDNCSNNENILQLINFDNNNIHNSKTLFFIFNRFLPNENRTDIIKKANIKDNDDDFTKLIKVSKLSLDKDQFWIG